MSDDPRDAPTPRFKSSAEWALEHQRVSQRIEEARDLALSALDTYDFDTALRARRLQLRGIELAEKVEDWRRLPRDNQHRHDAINELWAYSADVVALAESCRTGPPPRGGLR